jgi:hypothetical protein
MRQAGRLQWRGNGHWPEASRSPPASPAARPSLRGRRWSAVRARRSVRQCRTAGSKLSRLAATSGTLLASGQCVGRERRITTACLFWADRRQEYIGGTQGGRTINRGVLMKQNEHLPAVVLCAILVTALLNPPPQRNSGAPDASPWRGWAQSNAGERSRPRYTSCRSFQRARRVTVRLLNVTQGQRHDDET